MSTSQIVACAPMLSKSQVMVGLIRSTNRHGLDTTKLPIMSSTTQQSEYIKHNNEISQVSGDISAIPQFLKTYPNIASIVAYHLYFAPLPSSNNYAQFVRELHKKLYLLEAKHPPTLIIWKKLDEIISLYNSSNITHDSKIPKAFAKYGTLSFAKLFCTQTCDTEFEQTWKAHKICKKAPHFDRADILRSLYVEDGTDGSIIYATTKRGNIECLAALYEKGCIVNELACSYIIRYGHLECAKYLHERGHSCGDYDICDGVSSAKHVQCVKYFTENGLCKNISLTHGAARHGHLECLQYLHEQGYPWDEMTCAYAAMNGHIGCLKYAHEHGCPWNATTYRMACKNYHTGCMRYALDNNCLGENERIPTPEWLDTLSDAHPSIQYTINQGLDYLLEWNRLQPIHIKDHFIMR